MLLQFRTEDESLFLLDTQSLKWFRVSEPPVADEKGELIPPPILEGGDLNPQGFGIYALNGRTPATAAPGAGLCTVGVLPIAEGTILTIYVSSNVLVKEFTMPVPISTVRYEVRGPMPGLENRQTPRPQTGKPGVVLSQTKTFKVRKDENQSNQVAPREEERSIQGSVSTGTGAEESSATEAGI